MTASPCTRLLLAGASILALASIALTSTAQAADPASVSAPQSASTAGAATVDTIIITAEKRSVNIQDAPVAVTALTANAVLQRGLTGTQSLSAAVPGLVFNSPGEVGNPFIRGVGTTLSDPSSEQSVAMYVDGVYIASPDANLFNFNNIEQIEVLKGPQGTLFGRNATGGVIQITTKDPSPTPSGMVSVGYGSYDDVTASAYVTGPINDIMSADLAALYENQGEGYGHDRTTGASTFQQAVGDYSIRGKLLITPTPTTKILVSADFGHTYNNDAYQTPGVDAVDGAPYPGHYNTLDDENDNIKVDTGGGSLKITQDLGLAKVTSITSYRQTSDTYNLDDDVTSLAIANIKLLAQAHNWTQELQLSNGSDSNIKWVAGVFYYSSYGGYKYVDIDGANNITDKQLDTSYAGFGQVTVPIMADTNITAGVRYTTEDQKFVLSYPVENTQSQSASKVTYRLSIDHHFTKDVMGYVSYNTGFKSGGYNLLVPDDAFKPETLDATEVGLKTELFDHRLRLNVDAFYYTNNNLQVDTVFLGGIYVVNAGEAIIKGLEADFDFVPVQRLHISGGFSALHGRYTNDPGAVPISATGVSGAPINAKGNETVMTPPFTGSFSVDYSFQTDFGRIRPNVTVIYNSGYYWQIVNRLQQPSYTLLNASVDWAFNNTAYDLRLWAKNLTDATYFISRNADAGLGDNQEQAPPRTFGVTLTRHF
jgi:iron complex outermembrane receptor protein